MENKKAQAGDNVKVHYTGRFENGDIFDSSLNKDPLEFTLKHGQMIPGFEEAVVGMKKGETKSVAIEPEQAYGAYRDDLVLKIERSNFPSDINPEVGQKLQMSQQNGEQVVVTVTEFTDDDVTLDANHPLAGKNLTFDIELVEIT